jgi:hypothetical protein
VQVSQVIKIAQRLLGSDVEAERVNGVCRLTRPAREGEEAPGRLTRAGRVVLGAGPSWMAALKYATKEAAAAQQAKDAEDEAEVRKERAEFEAWLLTQYEGWKASRPQADAPPAG